MLLVGPRRALIKRPAAVVASGANITVDGSETAANSGQASITRTISTAGTNRILVADVYLNSVDGAGAAQTISSIADGQTLTWTLKQSITMHGGQGTAWHRFNRYWALAAAQLTNDTVTVTLGGATDHANINVIAIAGLNTATPFDVNANGSKQASATGFGTNPMDATGLSTTNANTLLLVGLGSSYAGDTDLSDNLETGYTLDENGFDGGGTNNGLLCMCHKIVSATQSGVAGGFNVPPNGLNGWLTLFDALQAA